MKKVLFPLLIIISLLNACSPDRVSGPEPPRDRNVQGPVDENVIQGFLENYSYNDKDLILEFTDIDFFRIKDNDGNPIVLTSEEDNRSSGASLLSMLGGKLKTFKVEEGGYKHDLYYLQIRQGEGKPIAISDDLFIGYEGYTIGTPEIINQEKETVNISANTFDTTGRKYIWLNGFSLVDNNTLERRTIPGFYQVVSKFKTAPLKEGGSKCNIVGGISGLGVMIIPSGLAYYNAPPSVDIKEYSNLVFKFNILNNEQTDLDGDGISDYEEGINSNDPNDTDNDGSPNFNDSDDDNDGVLTRNEVIIGDNNEKEDSDCDGIVNNDSDLIDIPKTGGVANYLLKDRIDDTTTPEDENTL